jgi:long-chain fatty acid transport protein
VNRKTRGNLAILALGFFTACTALAQTNLEVNAGLELNLSQPGARSLGMGGAFIGLADDATAAYTNPAGLANITVTEIALEGRAWDYKTKFSDDGSVFFRNGQMDDSAVIDGETSTSRSGVSFGSIVYPGKNWTSALYFHQLANYEANISTAGVVAFGGSGQPLFYRLPIKGSTELEIQSVGGAFAYRAGKAFSLGFSAASTRLTWSSSVRRFETESDRDDDYWLNEQILTSDEEGVTGSVGFQWRVAEHFHVGGVYRLGPEFDIATTSALGPAAGFNNSIRDQDAGTVKFPDSYGLGLAISSTSFRFLVDWVRVEYSAMTASTINVINNTAEDNLAASYLKAEDADEVHAGFEFVFSQMVNPLAIRIGGYFDPDHKVIYDGPLASRGQQSEAMIFRPGDNQIHYSAGLGLNIQDGRYELNLAADIADRVNTVSFSFVTRPF